MPPLTICQMEPKTKEPTSSAQRVASNVPSALINNTRAASDELRALNNPLNNGGFIKSTLRSYSQDLSRVTPGDPKGFMSELVHRITNIIRIKILIPLPANVRLELLKKNPMPFPMTLWSGENDLNKFETWLVELVSWMSGNRWKGKGYNEQHINAHPMPLMVTQNSFSF